MSSAADPTHRPRCDARGEALGTEAAPAGDEVPETDATDPDGGEPTTAATAVEDGAPEMDDAAAEPPESMRVGHVRAAPRYGRFMFFGALVGLFVAFGLSFVPDQDNISALGRQINLTQGQLMGALALLWVPIGLLVGAVVAYLLDRRSLRRRERVIKDL